MRNRAFLAAVLVVASWAEAQPVGTAFTYQGRYHGRGQPRQRRYDLQFALFDTLNGGAQVGSTLVTSAVPVADGLRTVSLDFGLGVFTGNARWLEIGVRPGGSSGGLTLLAPRQQLTPSPNATYSATTGDPIVQRRSVPPTCLAGQYLQSLAADGTPTCAPDVDTNSGGTVTSVATGAGLTGGPVTSIGHHLDRGRRDHVGDDRGRGRGACRRSIRPRSRRVVLPGCPVGQYLRGINSDGVRAVRAAPRPRR